MGSLVAVSMALTLVSGFLLARLFGQRAEYGALAGAGTAVCGASATLATATVLPQYQGKEADVVFIVVAVNAPGVTVVCRKPAARDANPFSAPLSARFDELDGQMWLDDVLIPWDRVFLTEPLADPVARWLFWHQLYCWLSKAEFTLGLALACTQAMGLANHELTIDYLLDLITDVQTVRACQTAAERDPEMTADGYCSPNHSHLAVGSIAMLKARRRMAEILRILPGSSLVVAPSDKDLADPALAAGLEESYVGGGYSAWQRAALLPLGADSSTSVTRDQRVLLS